MAQPLRARKVYGGAPYQTPGTVPAGAPYGDQPQAGYSSGLPEPIPQRPAPRGTMPLRGPTDTAFYGFNVGVPTGPEQQPTAQPSRQPTTRPGLQTVSSMRMSPTGATQTSYWQPPPGPAPTFQAPEYDEAEIRKLTQRYAAAPTRRLRETIRRIAGQAYGSPMVKRMTLREALEGYGTALESVMAGAGRAAAGEYAGRYAREFQAAQIGFQALYNQWTQEGRRVSTTRQTYEQPEGLPGAPGPNMMKVITQAGTTKYVPRTRT